MVVNIGSSRYSRSGYLSSTFIASATNRLTPGSPVPKGATLTAAMAVVRSPRPIVVSYSQAFTSCAGVSFPAANPAGSVGAGFRGRQGNGRVAVGGGQLRCPG